MSPFFHLCLCLLVAIGLAGCKPSEKQEPQKTATTNAATERVADKDDAQKEKTPELVQIERNTNGETVLTVSADIQKRIALTTSPAVAVEHSPELKAYGSVLDPSPLIALHGDLAAAEASIAALKVVSQRSRALFEAGEGIARKAMEAAEADLQMAQIKDRTLQRQLAVDWGENIAKLDATNRQELVDKLADGRTQLIRIDLFAGESLAGLPKSARVSVMGSDQWTPVAVVSRAAKADPKTQGEGYILRSDNAGPALRPGASVTALLQLPGDSIKGAIIPRASILRVEGKTWVYLCASENKFARHEVTLDYPLDSGWFTKNGVLPGDKIVTEAAQVLLSEEQKSQIKAD